MSSRRRLSALSRATGATTIHHQADSLEQAIEDLRQEWAKETRLRWVIDTEQPEGSLAARRAQLVAERGTLATGMPPDPTADIESLRRERDRLEEQRQDLREGRGFYARHPLGTALRELRQADADLARVERNAVNTPSRKERRDWRADIQPRRQWRAV